jgi:signal transduction histidine kinase
LEGKAYVEEMASNLSHELKTPLAAIRGSAELLQDGAMDDLEARSKFLANIQREVQRLDRIVNELLKLSRIETHALDREAQPVDAAPIFREIAAVYQQRMNDGGVSFVAEVSPDLPPVAIPELELHQLLTNLLDNALQFTPAGRTVRFTVQRDESTLEILICDEGQGIEHDLLPKIFDRFFTTENPRTGNRGTGLGLAIVKSIAVINGGEISVRSHPAEGSEFTVRFPVARADLARS